MLRSQLSIGTSNTLLVFLTFLTISRAVQHFLFALSWDVPARTKTDSETPPDSETRDSETARRIQKLHVGFRNYFAGFPRIQKLFRGIQKIPVVFRNYSWNSETVFVGFRNYSWYSETIFVGFRNYFRRIQKLFVVFRNYFRRNQKLLVELSLTFKLGLDRRGSRS